MFDPVKTSFALAIGAADWALQTVVAPFSSWLRPLALGIRRSVRPFEGRIDDRLKRWELDLALLTSDTMPCDLPSRRLLNDSYVWAVRKGYPDAGTGTISPERFCALDYALTSYCRRISAGATDRALAAMGQEVRDVVGRHFTCVAGYSEISSPSCFVTS